MNITIIGCGYVGTAVASYWHQQQEHFITVTTTTKERVEKLKEVASRVVVMKGNDTEAMRSLVREQDIIFVSVAPTSDREVDGETYAETYLPTARNLVAALRDAPSIKQAIYLSSCTVYGNRNGEWVDETFPVAPVSLHGVVLSEAEQILLQANVKVSIFRLGGIYGSGRELEKRFRYFAGTTLPGTGENFINLVHLDDIVAAVEFVRERQCQGIFNLVSDEKLTTRELWDRGCDRFQLPKVLWDSSQISRRGNNVRVQNQKLKDAGYRLIHPNLSF